MRRSGFFCLSWLLAASSSGCLPTPPQRNAASDAGPPALTFAVQDWFGHVADPAALPRRPRLQVTLAQRLARQPQAVWLLEGEVDAELLGDLREAPLSAAHTAKEVQCDLAFEGAQVTVTPKAALVPGHAYTLAIAGFGRLTDGSRLSPYGDPWTRSLRVADDLLSGAAVTASWPADGSSGVGTNLQFAALVLDGEVSGLREGVWLADAQGLAVATGTPSLVPCAELDASGGCCVQLPLEGALQPNAHYTLTTGHALLDAHGAPVQSSQASFTTAGGPDLRAPRWTATQCASDETSAAIGCILADDVSISLRMTTDAAVRAQVEVAGTLSSLLAPQAALRWRRAGMQANQTLPLQVTLLDAAGNATRAHLKVAASHALATLSINEVRADPLGSEPAQEYVELLNYGTQPVALRGFSLSDDPLWEGTPIVSDAVVEPGARALLVPDSFDASDSRDVVPPAGALLVRVGPTLGKSGLANQGEVVLLRDPDHHRISSAPASPAPRPGVCIVRVSADMRSGEAGSFGYDADETCTPGY